MTHTLTVRVYYEDTDFGGVVYYANYLKFIERGRSEYLREIGVDQIALKDAGVVFVVRQANVGFLSPARFDDLIEVRTRPVWVKRASAGMRQEIWRGDTRLIEADVTIACMGESGRPVRLPERVVAAMQDGL